MFWRNKKNILVSSSTSSEGMVLECVKCGELSHTIFPYLSYHIICVGCRDNMWRHKYGSRAAPEFISPQIQIGKKRPNTFRRKEE